MSTSAGSCGTEQAAPPTTAVVGRQPIIDRNGETVGYELLFRPLPTSETAYDPAAAGTLDGDEMTNQTIFGALGIGIDKITGGKQVFCNADRGVLTGIVPVSLPPKQTVIEVLETVIIDDEVLAGCRALRAAGYRLAADDFVYYCGADALLELVDIVKIDVQAVPRAEIPALIERCRRFRVQLVAEKIETPEELTACMDLGFEFFQGYHLGRPQTISGPTATPSYRGAARLASAILTDDADIGVIEGILRGEPELTYQVLQLAAIGRFGENQRRVRGIREALVLIGLDRLRGWLPALLLRPRGRAVDTNLPTVLARARMTELLADRFHPGHGDMAFTAGMLRALHLLIGIPESRLPALLEIPEALHRATFDPADPIGRVVRWVVDYHRIDEDTGTGIGTGIGQSAAPATPGEAGPPDRPDGRDGPYGTTLAEAAAHAFCWATRSIDLIDHPVAV